MVRQGILERESKKGEGHSEDGILVVFGGNLQYVVPRRQNVRVREEIRVGGVGRGGENQRDGAPGSCEQLGDSRT